MNGARRTLRFLLPLAAVHFALAMTAFSAEPTADDARAALQRRSFPWYDATKDAFRPIKPEAETRTDYSFLKWFFNLFNGFGSVMGPVLRFLMWAVLAALVVALLIALFRSMQGVDLQTNDSAETKHHELDLEKLEALPEPTRGVRDLLGEAERLAAQAAFGPAMTFYHSWQLVQLDQQHLIEVQKGKTNRQYSREVQAAKPDLVGLFGRSIRLFEDAFFGNLPVSREDFQQVWEQRRRFSTGSRGFRS